MADKIEYSRMLVKRTDQTGEVPTVPPITATTLNQFIPTDLFVGEFFLNEVDDLLWVRTSNGILPISLSGSTGTTTTPTLTQVLFQGNTTNGYNIDVSAGDTIVFQGLNTGSTTQFLGIDTSGNTIVSGVIPGTPDLQSVLFQGNQTNGNDIEVSSGDTIVFDGLTTGSTSNILGIDASGNTIITTVAGLTGEYLPLSGGTVSGNTYFGATSGITIDQVNNRLGINTATPQYTIEAFGTKSNVTYQDTAGGVLQISGDTMLPRFSVVGAPSLTKPLFALSVGVRTYDDTTFPGYGKVGDGHLYASNEMNGLNIINRQGTGTTEDYIRFYAGQDANGTTPDIHIQGSGATRGYVGIGTINPTQPLDVAGNTRVGGNLILRTIGSGTSVINLGLDSSGVVVTGTTGGSSPFETSTGLNSVRSTYYTTNAPNPYDMLIGGSGNTITNSTKFNHIFGGENNTISASREDGLNTIVGSYASTIGPTFCGLASGIFSSYQSTLNTGGFGSVIMGGWQNSLEDLNQWGSAIVGGWQNVKEGGSGMGFIGAGRNNRVNGEGGGIVGGGSNTANYRCFVGGGTSNNVGGNSSAIIGGEGNTISNGTFFGMLSSYNNSASMGNDTGNAMIAGHSNIFNANGVQGNTLIGGRSNSWYHFDSRDPVIGAPRYGLGSMIGGYQNIIAGLAGTASGSHAFPLLLGGRSNELRGEESNDSATSGCSIINSYSSTIIDGALLSAHIETTGSTISGRTQAVMIGTINRTANDDNTTYTENQRSFGQIYNGYYDNGPGSSFTIDWNRGNSQKITITGDTGLTFTNSKDGAQYRLQVVNAGTHDITGVTASGYSILCEGAAIPNITNNGIDLCVLEVMGEDILVRHFANFATP
jgi:hypothetical protein